MNLQSEKCRKKFSKYLEVSKKCRYFAPGFALKCVEIVQKKVLKKNFEKVVKKFGSFKNLPYLCTTFALIKQQKVENKGSKNFLKKVSEKFGGLKKTPYLCTTFASVKMRE